MSSIDQQFIEYIVKSLVGHPDDVKIERRIDEKGVLLELSVNPEDLGRVIGKRGATAQSIRTLLRALGTKNDARYNLKIIDTGPPPSRRTDDSAQAPADQSAQATTEEPVSADATDDKPATMDEPAKTDDDKVAVADEPAASKGDTDMAQAEKISETPPSEEHSDVISRTRKELADLDDLDV